jgi:hypothetical protein
MTSAEEYEAAGKLLLDTKATVPLFKAHLAQRGPSFPIKPLTIQRRSKLQPRLWSQKSMPQPQSS